METSKYLYCASIIKNKLGKKIKERQKEKPTLQLFSLDIATKAQSPKLQFRSFFKFEECQSLPICWGMLVQFPFSNWNHDLCACDKELQLCYMLLSSLFFPICQNHTSSSLERTNLLLQFNIVRLSVHGLWIQFNYIVGLFRQIHTSSSFERTHLLLQFNIVRVSVSHFLNNNKSCIDEKIKKTFSLEHYFMLYVIKQ